MKRRSNLRIEPMTLGNMRENGVRSLAVYCWQCHHEAVLSVDPWPQIPVPSFGPRNGVHALRQHRGRYTAELAGAGVPGDLTVVQWRSSG
jgi:hypothetical protein